MSNEDSEDLEKLSYYGDQMPPQMVAQKMGLPKQGVIKFAPEQLRNAFLNSFHSKYTTRLLLLG